MRSPMFALSLALALAASVTSLASPATAAPGLAPPPPPPAAGNTIPAKTPPTTTPPPHRGPRNGDGSPGLTAEPVQYFYGGAFQAATSDGAVGTFTAYPGLLADPAGSHSLVELAVESADSKQIVEIGLTIDQGLNGNSRLPGLFVYHWVDGAPTCYNACGFVRVLTDPAFNTPFVANSIHRLAIQHRDGAWWLYDSYKLTPLGNSRGGWLGYFPDDLWGGRYTKAGEIQWFGEVSATTSTPCTDMGNGQFPSDTSASIQGMGLLGGPAVNYFLNRPKPSLYDANFGPLGGPTPVDSVRYGGPGAC